MAILSTQRLARSNRAPAQLREAPAHRPLGQLLVESGDLTVSQKLKALEIQTRTTARFGDVLLAQGLITEARLFAAIAEQFGADVAEFESSPADNGLIEIYGATRCLEESILPWRRRAGLIVVVTSRPETFEARRDELEDIFGPVIMAVASDRAIQRAVNTARPRELTERAEVKVPSFESCREWRDMAVPKIALLLVAGTIFTAFFAPVAVMLILCCWAVIALLASSAMKFAALLWKIRDDRRSPNASEDPIIARMPGVSILVPLYKEREIAKRLIRRLDRLTYPKAILDICLVVEEDDATTRNAIAATDLPRHMRAIVVPNGTLRTKPRAMNYALDFCRGQIIGIYDAEDAPAPDQLERVVERFHARGPEVACLQGILDFYNARTNWLSRCFTLDYAGWFRTFLPGLAGLGFVIPLGGTTVFFRRDALEKVGAWDAHNVTEDADLGIRLARRGYRTELIDTVTEEEANCLFWPWIKQRSRWLKGYTLTWAVHMRQPRKLFRELGILRFVGVQVFFLGTITQIALAPFLWTFWLVWLGVDHPVLSALPHSLVIGLGVMLFASELINLALAAYGARGPKHRRSLPWLLTMIFYHPLAALAIYKGFFELIWRPFYWDKTRHGRFDQNQLKSD